MIEVSAVLRRHKDWLDVFKLKMKLKKEMDDDEQRLQEEKFHKVKEVAAKDREKTRKMKEEFEKLN